MNSISEYLNENLDNLVFELKGETYMNAAKKAKKLGDPRAEKFLQAYKDNIDREFAAAEGPDADNTKFNTFYNADKKSITRLKGLAKDHSYYLNNNFGTFLNLTFVDVPCTVHIAVVTDNKDPREADRAIFLRQSIISENAWKVVAKKFAKISDKLTEDKASKAFTFVRVFTNEGIFEFFYLIDDDIILPIDYKDMSDDTKLKVYDGDDSLDNLKEDDKNATNKVCKAMNQNHKDI